MNELKFERFMIESNRIEGEDRLNPGDIHAVYQALVGIKAVEDILDLHKILGEHLRRNWVGRWRTCNVRVGNYTAPNWKVVSVLMNGYILDLPKLDSFEAHNNFEQIHPFRDLNGRMGRLIWLSKAVKEGYNFEIPFLQKYYYQVLGRNGTNLY